jgi:hypothetical protein
MAVVHRDLTTTLEELIAAIDRRMPHLEREGEAAIAQDAAQLRAKAMGRLAELTGDSARESSTSGPATTTRRRR